MARRASSSPARSTSQKGDALYGRYWGALQPLRHLHFNVCYYAGIEHCIERGLARFEPGAGGEYKQLRGFDATPTWSCHFLADPRLADAVRRFLERERARGGARDRLARRSHGAEAGRRRGLRTVPALPLAAPQTSGIHTWRP